MWHIQRIIASNICAFENFDYQPKLGEATLIFGDNQDSESQNSNGSGKSALIEAIAIGLTGEPLRKVNMDEIINDRFDEAVVSIYLKNPETNCIMTVNRKLSRKQPQTVQIIRQYGPYDEDVEEVVQASVADYNKYVLEQIGLSKDDILSNFILTARKYKSFLSSSDKEKKEIINRFSNGIIVDESIEALHSDIEPVQNEYVEAEKKVASCNGSILAMESEIERAINDSNARKEKREALIEGWQNAISEKRAEIRKANRDIDRLDQELDTYNTLDVEMQDLEQSDVDTISAYKTIKKRFEQYNFAPIADYTVQISENQKSLETTKNDLDRLYADIDNMVADRQTISEQLFQISKQNAQKNSELDTEATQIDNNIKELTNTVIQLRNETDKLNASKTKLSTSIASLETQLAGVVECPKCHHEFLVNKDIDVIKARNQIDAMCDELQELNLTIAKADESYDKTVQLGRKHRERQSAIYDERQQLQEKYNKVNDQLNGLKTQLAHVERMTEVTKTSLAKIQDSLSNVRKKMFDEVFDAIDHYVKQATNQQDANIQLISNLEGAIKSYAEQIKEAEKSQEDDVLNRLVDSKTRYEKDLKAALSYKNEIETKLNELKVQEATFIEFKTYLANTKINAIAQITNDFLATIGSDIRVALSGYTVLKSGKVRDKISVSVMRDGVDCGSFEKFSAGERVRLELASILAMRQLTNVNAEEGKGLDLLICDEILDSSDESGLTNIFKALNSTGVTSLVVSHGSVAENYPNRLVIHKQNGVSYLDENSK